MSEETPAPVTPGQAAYDAYWKSVHGAEPFAMPYDGVEAEYREAWEAAAQAAIKAHPVVALTSAKRDAALREGRELRREINRLGDLLEKTSMAKCDAMDDRDRLTERVAELVTEGNELRRLVGEILDWYTPIGDANSHRATVTTAQIAGWRELAGLASVPAVATAGTEHLAAQLHRLAIPDEEDSP